MNIVRNEIRTGLLVVLTLAALVAVLIYLGAPGAFVPQHRYHLFFDNAAGIKPGAAVLLAGRKIGQVRLLDSPVPEKDRPDPKLETVIDVDVEATAKIYRKVKVQMTQTSLLGESVIDFTNGDENSGLAPNNSSFIGERPGALSDALPAVLNRIDPVIAKVTVTLDSLQKTSENLTRLTSEGADLPIAFSALRKFGINLDELTDERGPLRHALGNVETLTQENGQIARSFRNLSDLTSPEGPLSKTLDNTEIFTARLSENKDIDIALKNFRVASEEFNNTFGSLSLQFATIGTNLEQATDTVKRQPWRLIWPTTKKYPNDARALATPAASPIVKVKRKKKRDSDN